MTLCMPILHHKCKILLYVKYFISCSFLLVSGLWDNTKTKLKCTLSCFRLKETDPTLPLNYVFITSATLHFSSAMKRLITLWNMITIMSLYRVLFHKQHNHPSAKILCSLLQTNQKNVISSPVQAVSGCWTQRPGDRIRLENTSEFLLNVHKLCSLYHSNEVIYKQLNDWHSPVFTVYVVYNGSTIIFLDLYTTASFLHHVEKLQNNVEISLPFLILRYLRDSVLDLFTLTESRVLPENEFDIPGIQDIVYLPSDMNN